MDELISELNKFLKKEQKVTDNQYLVMGDKYSPLILSDNFNAIEINNSNSKKISFIDGGNSIIFETPNFCLAIIRSANVVYFGDKKISSEMKEFYAFVVSNSNSFNIMTFPKNEFNNLELQFSKYPELRSTSDVINLIRRLFELETAKNYSLKNDFDFILLDGTLECRTDFEINYLSNIKRICSISKTCNLKTNLGKPVISELSNLSKVSKSLIVNNENFEKSKAIKSWFYYPIIENNNTMHPSNIYFVKLSSSDYIFRFEIKNDFDTNNQYNHASDIINSLTILSNDPVFMGYPYGLIEADSLARVSEDEKKFIQLKILSKLESNQLLINSLKSVNAHEILDKIKF